MKQARIEKRREERGGSIKGRLDTSSINVFYVLA